MKSTSVARLFFVLSISALVSAGPWFGAFNRPGLMTGEASAQTTCTIGTSCLPAVCTEPTPCAGCVVVSPCTMSSTGWTLQSGTDTPDGTNTGSFGFQTGPDCPPAGLGSAEFLIGADGNSFFRLRNSNFGGTKLTDLTALSYCTYVQFRQPGTCVAPYIGLTVDWNGDNLFDDVLYFEPCYQTGLFQTFDAAMNIQIPTFAGEFYPVQNGGVVATCSWQCWNALGGAWWSAIDAANNGGPIPAFTTLANYFGRAGNADTKILNPDACRGGVRIEGGEGAGPWDCFHGNADKFTIAVGNSVPASSVTYDFETGDCPIPACGVSPSSAITACKFYDANANGIRDPQEPTLDNWPITLSPLGSAIPQDATQLTSNGCVSWANLDTALNPYSVSEATPNETNWVHSTPSSVGVTVAFGETSSVEFGNYCRVGSGGLTIGFWGNKNGQALITEADLALLRACNLVDEKGDPFNPVNKGQVKNWLQKATATNMAYMLSAQLAAMKLNVAHGFVDPTFFAGCFNGTVAQLIAAADAALAADGLTPVGDPNRATQETLKNCLDSLNNGGFVIPPTPCSYSFPQPAQRLATVGQSSATRVGHKLARLFQLR